MPGCVHLSTVLYPSDNETHCACSALARAGKSVLHVDEVGTPLSSPMCCSMYCDECYCGVSYLTGRLSHVQPVEHLLRRRWRVFFDWPTGTGNGRASRQ